MIEQDANIKGLKREWLAARIFVLVGGLLFIALCVLAVLSIVNGPSPASAGDPATAAQRQAAAAALCTAALTTTQGFAIVPAYAKLASDLVRPGSVDGRYSCFAQTDAAKYQITFDLMCSDLNDPKCINLFSVTQDGTGIIYQRR